MCGCLKIEEAERMVVAPDDKEGASSRDDLINIGKEMAEAWGCPG